MNYDVIGDIHGHAEALKALLAKLGYTERLGAWRHAERQAIFVGDFIDRGPAQTETVELVRAMLDAGSAQAVMGNHEFNAIAWYMTDPQDPDSHLRGHGDKNFKQHERFLAEVIGTSRHKEIIEWAKTLPLWLELDGIRVIHACWHQECIDYLIPRLATGNRLTDELIVEATRRPEARQAPGEMSVHDAVEILLKGYEIKLPAGCSFKDKDNHERHDARLKWWNMQGGTFRDMAFVPYVGSAPEWLDTPMPPETRFWKDDGDPVFVGHYWLDGHPKVMSPKVAVIDYSIAKGGKLVAYRFEGEAELGSRKLEWVGKPDGGMP